MRQRLYRTPGYEKFRAVGAKTDAIVMLISFGDGLSSVVTEKYAGKVKFDEPTEIGDIAACASMIREYLQLNPEGRAYIYTAWPMIPGVRETRRRIRDEEIKSAMAGGKSLQEAMATIPLRKPSHEVMEPFRRSFDYAAHWSTDDDIPIVTGETAKRMRGYMPVVRRNRDKVLSLGDLAKGAGVDEERVREDLRVLRLEAGPIQSQTLLDAIASHLSISRTHCRQYMYQLMEELIRLFPDLWREGRLGMVPVGDVFLALDEKMRAGEVPGIVNIGEYSADGTHLRSGLPRYTLAATYYAVLFRDRPSDVDWKVFQDRANYESGKFGFYVHQPDLAVHLDITAERAKIVNDTVWEVVSEHRYTAMQRGK
jgi:hypothetical protein